MCRPELRNRSTLNSDRDLLTGFGATQDLADVVAELLLGDGRHGDKVVEPLPVGRAIHAGQAADCRGQRRNRHRGEVWQRELSSEPQELELDRYPCVLSKAAPTLRW